MADSISRTTRHIQVYSPLPDDVLPKIMLRVEDHQDFKRLARTCHGFYAWSEPWLKSRRQAAELNRDPQRLVKLPAWIKTNSRHMHAADWDAIQRWDNAGENRSLADASDRSAAFDSANRAATRFQQWPTPLATDCNAAHLDFILFSPRLLADVNEEVARRANERLVANACFVLTGFSPSGEAWQYDVLAGAVAWIKENAAAISFDAHSFFLRDLTMSMHSVMVAQRSPSLAIHLLKHGLSKSHNFSPNGRSGKHWAHPLLNALVMAARKRNFEAGSPEASSFFSTIHLVISILARSNETAALSILVKKLKSLMKLMSEDTWTPGTASSSWLHALVQAVRDVPEMLADIRKKLIGRGFITQDGWNALVQPEPVADPDKVEVSAQEHAQ